MRLPDCIIEYLDVSLPVDATDTTSYEVAEDRAYRNAVESLALACLSAGMKEKLLLACVQDAVEAYGNNS